MGGLPETPRPSEGFMSYEVPGICWGIPQEQEFNRLREAEGEVAANDYAKALGSTTRPLKGAGL